jgi:hypothetical protein
MKGDMNDFIIALNKGVQQNGDKIVGFGLQAPKFSH